MTQKRQLAQALALLFVMNTAMISLIQQAGTTTYRQGSSSGQMRTIQTKPKNWGYYDSAAGGIHGSQTAQAVKYLQRKNGLIADGIAGPATLKALGMPSSGGGSSSQQNSTALLTRVISTEARSEPYSGQVVVGVIILNRVERSSFPNTIVEVVYQPGAFTRMVDGQFNKSVTDSAYRATQNALNGVDPSGRTIYYSGPDTATNTRIWGRSLIKTVGRHRLCAQ